MKDYSDYFGFFKINEHVLHGGEFRTCRAVDKWRIRKKWTRRNNWKSPW